jgi:hypothetical protein
MTHPAAMTEVQLRAAVRDICRELQLLAQYAERSERCWLAGWPDLEIIGPGGILHRELKTMRGEVSGLQRAVGAGIIRAGGDWAVWRPVDYYGGIVRSQLTALSMPRRGAPNPIAGRPGGTT